MLYPVSGIYSSDGCYKYNCHCIQFKSSAFEPNWAIRPELVPVFFDTARNFSATPWMGC